MRYMYNMADFKLCLYFDKVLTNYVHSSKGESAVILTMRNSIFSPRIVFMCDFKTKQQLIQTVLTAVQQNQEFGRQCWNHKISPICCILRSKTICIFLGFACSIWTAVIRYTEPILSGHAAECCESELGVDVIVTQWSRGQPPRSAQNCRCVSRWLLCRLSKLPTANFWYDGEVWSACDVDRRCRWWDTGSNRWRVYPLPPERGKVEEAARWRSSVWQPRHSRRDSAKPHRTTMTSWCTHRVLDTGVHSLPLCSRQVAAPTACKQSSVCSRECGQPYCVQVRRHEHRHYKLYGDERIVSLINE